MSVVRPLVRTEEVEQRMAWWRVVVSVRLKNEFQGLKQEEEKLPVDLAGFLMI